MYSVNSRIRTTSTCPISDLNSEDVLYISHILGGWPVPIETHIQGHMSSISNLFEEEAGVPDMVGGEAGSLDMGHTLLLHSSLAQTQSNQKNNC